MDICGWSTTNPNREISYGGGLQGALVAVLCFVVYHEVDVPVHGGPRLQAHVTVGISGHQSSSVVPQCQERRSFSLETTASFLRIVFDEVSVGGLCFTKLWPLVRPAHSILAQENRHELRVSNGQECARPKRLKSRLSKREY